MKKVFAILTVMVMCSTGVFAASGYDLSVKTMEVQDNQNNLSLIAQSQQSTAQVKKEQKIKELDEKLSQLNEEKNELQNSKDITENQRTIQLKAVERQIDFYTKQKAVLK